MNNLSKQVIQSYVRLLRTEKRVFGQDIPTLLKVTEQTRNQYRANRNETDPVKIDEMVQHANAVSEFLLVNTVQAVKKSDTKFALKFRPENELHVEKTYEFVGDQAKKRTVNRNRNKDTTNNGEQGGMPAGGCCGGGCH